MLRVQKRRTKYPSQVNVAGEENVVGSMLKTEVLRNKKNDIFHRRDLGTLRFMHCISINSVRKLGKKEIKL